MKLFAASPTTPDRKHKFPSLTVAALTCASLASPVAARATQLPRIHPKKIELVHAVVTGARAVPAYAAALGASTNQVGELYCLGLKIKGSTVFRVETASRYIDLLKWCNGYGVPYSWRRWEDLHVGETIIFHTVRQRVRLSIPRCEDLGLLNKAQAQKLLSFFSQEGERAYGSHCTYRLTEAYVKVPNERWIFRILDGGPRSKARNSRIGAGYSASLPPPW